MSPHFAISVIICTHNPKPDYMLRVLEALRIQTLSFQIWELLFIDNNSDTNLSNEFDLKWHPNSRHIREDVLGLTPARLRGIREAEGELLVFVDDDNILCPSYLENALSLIESFPQIKVFGGKVIPEFETSPIPETEPYLGLLALRDFNNNLWSNDPKRLGFYPCGAGLCVTKSIANAYTQMLSMDERRKKLDRVGSELTSSGDDDICFTAGALNEGVGLFTQLTLTHIIPKSRLTLDYLENLMEGITYSGYLLSFFWGGTTRPPKHSWRWRLGFWRLRLKMNHVERRFADAKVRAERRAWLTILMYENNTK